MINQAINIDCPPTRSSAAEEKDRQTDFIQNTAELAVESIAEACATTTASNRPKEKRPPKTSPTTVEYTVFGSFLLYMLIASIAVIKIDASTLSGPPIGFRSISAATEQMRERNQLEASSQIHQAVRRR